MTFRRGQEQEGYLAGLNEAGLPQHRIDCPYDGRTRAGKAWWRGFMEGDKERCETARKAAKETGQCPLP